MDGGLIDVIYRAMIEENGLPRLGASAERLGAVSWFTIRERKPSATKSMTLCGVTAETGVSGGVCASAGTAAMKVAVRQTLKWVADIERHCFMRLP